MSKFVNIHTHRPTLSADVYEVMMLDPRQGLPEITNDFCYGIHPWYLGQVNFENFQKKLNELIKHPHFWGMGEIGLDKAIINSDLAFDLQIELFKQQIQLAQKLKIKNLQIHCVRAYNECLKTLIDLNWSGRVLLHDYRGNLENLKQYQKHFPTYISLGAKSLITDKTALLISQIDLKYLFLETDDSSHINIQEIYRLAQSLLNIKLEELKIIIEKNLQAFIQIRH